MNNIRLIGCCMILFQTVFGMSQENRLPMGKDLLPIIIEYAVQLPDLFKKRHNLHIIAQISRQFRKASSQVLNQKENKSTIKCIIKAHDGVDTELLRSTPKNCPYGIKKIRVNDSDTYETIGYLIEDKKERLNALETLEPYLKFLDNDSASAVKNVNNIIDIINKNRIIIGEEEPFLQNLNQKIIDIEQCEPSEFVRGLFDDINEGCFGTLVYYIGHKCLYDQPIIDRDCDNIIVIAAAIVTLCSWMLSIESHKSQRVLSLCKTLKEGCTTISATTNYTILPISSSRYERYLDSIDLFKEEQHDPR